MHMFLLCSSCGKVYDENQRAPLKGSCSHSICTECHALRNSLDCLVCGKPDSFFGALRDKSICREAKTLTIEMNDDDFQKTVQANMNEIKGRYCSECKQILESKRICVSCMTDTETKMKQTSGNKWIVQYFSPENPFSSLSIVCADCILQNHDEHKTVALSRIENLEVVLGYELYLTHAESGILMKDVYMDILGKYFKSMDFCNTFLENDSNETEDCEVLSGDQKIRSLAKEVQKLTQRELKIRENHIQSNIIHLNEMVEKAKDSEEKKEREMCLKKVVEIKGQFSEITSHFALRETKENEIEEEVISRMNELEKSYISGSFVKIKESEDTMFYKHQALIQEYENVLNSIDSANKKFGDERRTNIMMERSNELVQIQEAIENLENMKSSMDNKVFEKQMNQLTKYQAFLKMELAENENDYETHFLSLLQLHEKLKYLDLMRLIFFPVIPEAPVDNATFYMLFENTINKNTTI